MLEDVCQEKEQEQEQEQEQYGGSRQSTARDKEWVTECLFFEQEHGQIPLRQRVRITSSHSTPESSKWTQFTFSLGL